MKTPINLIIDDPSPGVMVYHAHHKTGFTTDGKSGSIIEVLETGGYPILLTHWQSLASNGLYTGLRALSEVAHRIELHLEDKVEWTSAQKMMERVISDKKSYPKPSFENIKQ